MEKPMTEEEKQNSIKEFVEFTSKHVLTFFKMLGLNSHIDCQIHNEPTNEKFVFRFYRVESGYEATEDVMTKAILKLESDNKLLQEEIESLREQLLEEGERD